MPSRSEVNVAASATNNETTKLSRKLSTANTAPNQRSEKPLGGKANTSPELQAAISMMQNGPAMKMTTAASTALPDARIIAGPRSRAQGAREGGLSRR